MANVLVEFNDSPLGVVLGSVLHTLGAIAFLGGLVGYLAWHRHLAAQGHNHRRVLDTSAFLTYLAIILNLLGGFMRTFQTGHPHLTQWAESPWVRAIAIKHLFIFVGQGAAIYLFEVVAPRLVKAHKQGALADASPTGHRVGSVLVALGILVAAVLGALTQVVPLVSADAPIDDEPMVGPTVYHNFTGQLTSTPASPATATGSFEVLNTTELLHAEFTWTPAQASLQVVLRHGDQSFTVTGSGGTGEGSLDAPEPGTWTYEVSSGFAVGSTWTLSVAAVPVGGAASHDH
ncbi:MAG: hypothetical protein ACYC2H_02350 [Thermoplasmatota archaeon]